MSREYKGSVFIGRFQPPHEAHIESIKYALSIADKVAIVVGTSYATKTIKNPWSFDERVKMISDCLSQEDVGRISFIPQRDYPYNENLWISDIQRKAYDFLGDEKIVLVGLLKDHSSYYLRQFPQWPLRQPNLHNGELMHATDVRDAVFSGTGMYGVLSKSLNPKTVEYILEWLSRDDGQNLIGEYSFIQDYKDKWANSPYPPTFVTADSVVIKSGHVLMIQRKINPGKGLYALPGGFVGQNELIEDAAIRELKEETGLAMHESPIDMAVFDDPGRSLRGRTITHAFCFNLGTGELPRVKGGDDACRSFWMPISEVMINSEKIFEDHSSIIMSFVNKF